MSLSRIKVRSLLLCSLCLIGTLSVLPQAHAQDAPAAVADDNTPLIPTTAFPSILALDSDNTVWTLKVNNGLLKVNGDVAVNSTNKGAIWMANGSLNSTNGTVSVVGGVSRLGRVSIVPDAALGARMVADPLPEFQVPNPGNVMSEEKLFLNTDADGDATLTPGIYAGGIFATGQGRITMKPGTYIIANGDFDVIGATVQGQGVTIVMAGDNAGGLSVSLDAVFNASAPTSGKFKGLLFVSRSTGTFAKGIAFAKARGDLQGLVYAPSAPVAAQSGAQVRIGKVIAQSVTVDGARMEVTGSTAAAAPANTNNVGDGG